MTSTTGRSAASSDAWDREDAGEVPVRVLTRDEAQALIARAPTVSPWWVLGAQFALGWCVALVAWLLTGQTSAAWSALYGAIVVVVPGALLARGAASRRASRSPAVSAGSFLVWEMVKIGATFALLAVAGKLVQPLSWPALLAALVLCIHVYWLALLWRRPSKKTN
jgi:ATP synthase protein I